MRSIDFSSFIYSPKQRRHQGQTSVVDAPDVRCIRFFFYIYDSLSTAPTWGPRSPGQSLASASSPPRQSGSSIYIYNTLLCLCPNWGPGCLAAVHTTEGTECARRIRQRDLSTQSAHPPSGRIYTHVPSIHGASNGRGRLPLSSVRASFKFDGRGRLVTKGDLIPSLSDVLEGRNMTMCVRLISYILRGGTPGPTSSSSSSRVLNRDIIGGYISLRSSFFTYIYIYTTIKKEGNTHVGCSAPGGGGGPRIPCSRVPQKSTWAASRARGCGNSRASELGLRNAFFKFYIYIYLLYIQMIDCGFAFSSERTNGREQTYIYISKKEKTGSSGQEHTSGLWWGNGSVYDGTYISGPS